MSVYVILCICSMSHRDIIYIHLFIHLFIYSMSHGDYIYNIIYIYLSFC